MDENVRYGKSENCSTFNNPPLCKSRDFEIKVLEVYGFDRMWVIYKMYLIIQDKFEYLLKKVLFDLF